MTVDERPVILFNSAYNEPLRQTILTLISTQSEGLVEIDYDHKWLTEEVLDQAAKDNLKGRIAYFVFLNFRPSIKRFAQKGKPEFFPLRECRIEDVQTISKESKETIYRFKLSVHDLISMKDFEKFSNEIHDHFQSKGWDCSSDPSNLRVGRLVLIDHGLSSQKFGKSAEWRKIVEYLANLDDIVETGKKGSRSRTQFKSSLFYRYSLLDADQNDVVVPTNNLYSLRPGRRYDLQFEVYQPHFDSLHGLGAAVLAHHEPGLLTAFDGLIKMPLDVRAYPRTLSFWVERTSSRRRAKVILERTEDDFNAPRVEFEVEVSPSRLMRAVLYSFVGVGFVIIALTDQISRITGVVSLFWSLVGAVLTTLLLARLGTKN